MTDKKPKIAILHDAFLYRGGGERLVTLMAQAIDADLVSGFFSEGSFDPRELGFTGNMISLGRPVFAKGLRHAVLKSRFLYNTRFLAEYDIVIFSGNCLDAIRHIPKSTKKIYYCHTPPRYIFDLRYQYLAKMTQWLHFLVNPILDAQGRRYIDQLTEMDEVFTNSRNTHDRLLQYCQRASTILYPPTDTDRFVPVNSTEIPSFKSPTPTYFLSCSRLSPPKRVDLVVRAFQEMPERHLVFTYGANDPERARILALCEGYPNIHPIPAPSDADFITLLAGATANIYIPIDEDFGMTPVESMSCGVPVIGVHEGGLLETIIEGQTGRLLPVENGKLKIESLNQIIQNTPEAEWQNMREACRDRARDFSLENFSVHLKKYT